MKRYGDLFAQITAFDTLLLAARKAWRGKQQRISVAHFIFHLEPELLTLQEELRSGTYRLPGYVRYMDDVLVFAPDKPRLHETLATIRTFLHHTLHLTLKEEVTRLMPVTQGIAFLGFRVFPGVVRLDGRKWTRLRRRVRQREAQYRCGILDTDTLQRTVTSMLGHVSHADSLAARRTFFAGSWPASRGDDI